ncbi:MAG: hypothetical protein GXP08_06265, partial [Gammaproteobacteria bacterium]|nr:hypothetical protein [Gammaproteobacteria bacterium]
MSAPSSDDFHSNNINTSIWSIVDPHADSKFSIDSSRLSIQVAAGQSHDVWNAGNFAPRLMQDITDADFELVTKFDSIPAQQYQIQGMLIESDAANFIRFDIYTDGSNAYLFAANFVNNVPQVIINNSVNPTSPHYLKVSRLSNTWHYSYSNDNITWTPVATFNRSMVVSKVGLFAGNSGANPPAFTALFDYFFNTAAPIDPQDSGSITDNTAPNVYNQNISATDSSLFVQFSTDELSSATVQYGTTNSYELGSVTIPDYLSDHNITISGLSPQSLYHLKIVVQDSLGNIHQSQDQQFATLAAGIGAGPTIDAWYGSNQSFGLLGVPQRWVNILGNVNDPDGINSLQYSLNGAAFLPLTLGPDNRRLQRFGDFNIEIDYTTLNSGANTIDILAEDTLGNSSLTTINLTFNTNNNWPLPYSINWNTVSNIQDVAQVVDGKWSLEGTTIRTSEIGYDRLIAIGDLNWSDYEIVVPITIHAVDENASRPGIGLLLRWPGHYAWDTSQPRWGWWPMGALGWYRYEPTGPGTDKLRMLGGDGSIIDADNSGKKLTIGTTYLYKMRVETPNGQGSWYRLKVWEQGTPEPASWDLESQESTSDPQNGSLLLLAHHVDASFGTVNVTPIENNIPENPPIISNINVNANDTLASITWTTDKPTDSIIEYGLDNTYGNLINDATLTTNHSLVLAGLSPETLYHFQISGTDTATLTGVSGNQTFTTPA